MTDKSKKQKDLSEKRFSRVADSYVTSRTHAKGEDVSFLLEMTAMNDFLASFEAGLNKGRYIAGSLPDLPFADNQFDICLSSHFLLLYSANLSLQFHLESIKEMLRVAGEVRIFPLLNTEGKTSAFLPEILNKFNGDMCEIRRVDYEFQKGGNEMLLIKG